MIRAMYFDYHGVLDRKHFSGLLEVLIAAVPNPPADLRTRLEPKTFSYATGQIAPAEFWGELAATYGPAVATAGKAYHLHVDPIREMWELLNILHERFSLGLFSDCSGDKKDVIVHAYNLPDFFDQLIFSCDTRQSKIDPNFYRRMLRDGMWRPEECLLVDDSHQAIGQATALGFAAHQFVDAETLKKYLASNNIL